MGAKEINLGDGTRRILVLSACDPETDPRIRWITQLCAEVGRTDVLGFVLETDKPTKEYDGTTYLERVEAAHFPDGNLGADFISLLVLVMQPGLFFRLLYRLIRRFAYLHLRTLPWSHRLITFFKTKEGRWLHANRSVHIGEPEKAKCPRRSWLSVVRIIENLRTSLRTHYTLGQVSKALLGRAKAASIVPRIIICHNAATLRAAIKLKKLFGTPVIYDSYGLRLGINSQPTDELMCKADLIIVAAHEVSHLAGVRVLALEDEFQSTEYLAAIRRFYEG